MAFNAKKYLDLPEAEIYAIYLNTFALLTALGRPRYRKAAKAAVAALRIELHVKPRRGRHIKKGRRKVAANLRFTGIPDLPRRAAIGLRFGRGRSTTRRVQI